VRGHDVRGAFAVGSAIIRTKDQHFTI
jgi:hypothetical protein